MATTRTSFRSFSSIRVGYDWIGYVAWLGSAAVLGFAVPALFSGLLEMPRNWFLVPHFAITVPFLYFYFRWIGINVGEALRHRLLWGMIIGAVLSAFAVMNIVNNEPASPRPEGLDLVGAILWLGVAYGIVDALLLSVLPVTAVWLAFKAAGITHTWFGKAVAATTALLASLVVTAAYHLGYVEFRDADVFSALFGNGVMSLGFLITANPLTAVIAHIALHIVSVWHGIDTTVTLPPHY
jgi:hypothetical protein